MLSIADMIAKLQELPSDWNVSQTGSSGSLFVTEPGYDQCLPGKKYGYVFADGRPTKILTSRI